MEFIEVIKKLLTSNLLDCKFGTSSFFSFVLDGKVSNNCISFMSNDDVYLCINDKQMNIATSIFQSTTIDLEGIENITVKDVINSSSDKYTEIVITFYNNNGGLNYTMIRIRSLEENK